MINHPHITQAIEAIKAEPEAAAEVIALAWALLGARSEWDMEDNFSVTEWVAELSREYGLPNAFDQSDTSLRHWGEAAQSLGFSADLDDWEVCSDPHEEGCEESLDDGEGWDGACGDCTDRLESGKE